jgi:hypothetical protein
LKLIASNIDGNLPSGQEWHRDLLLQMGLDLPQVRPAVLSSGSIQNLEEYLRFRHVVRNVYTFSLNPDRVGKLVADLEPVFAQLRQELLAFAFFWMKSARDSCSYQTGNKQRLNYSKTFQITSITTTIF